MAGRGSFSTVYKATQRSQNNRPVALKLLHWGIQQKLTQRNPDATNPFLREKAIVSRLSHPAVCNTDSTGRSEEGRWYSVYEWVEGETIEDLLRKYRHGIPLSMAASLVRQLGEALSEMHRLQVVHRDLKPSNLMVAMHPERSEHATLRILDFGLARLAGEEHALGSTEPLLVGTPAYMSPEQSSKSPIDPRSDVFSAATIMYELLTGKRPIQLKQQITTAEDYVKYLLSDAALPTHPATELRSDLPDDVDEIFAAGLARERHMRTATIEMLCDDLEVVLRLQESFTARPTLYERAKSFLRRS